ncbi:MAG: hypothetical protein QW279_06875 [Candidatus Jordarchaeaceae archaeon]
MSSLNLLQEERNKMIIDAHLGYDFASKDDFNFRKLVSRIKKTI